MIVSGRRPVDPALLHTHADNLDAVRSLLSEVRLAGWQLGPNPIGFGPWCAPIQPWLGDRYAYHQEQLAYVEESLILMVEGLRRVAKGDQQLKELIRGDDDVATTDGTPVIDDPPHTLTGCMDSIIAGVQDRDWVEPELADAAPVAEFAAPVDDVQAALRSTGLHCAVAGVEPLRRLLDDLAGAPETIAAQASLWHTISADLHQLAVFLRQCLDHDLPRRDRLDVRSYLALMANNVEALIRLAEIAAASAVIMNAAGDLILLTRDIIRGITGNLFASTIVRALDTATAISRPVIAERLGTIVATTWRMHAYLAALTASIDALAGTVDG